MKYTIDAQGKKLGRLASEVAVILAGKNHPSFEKNKVAPVSVEVINASKIDATLKKKEETDFVRYSGYPGGLKHETMLHLINRKGMGVVLEKAIKGMLPANKLRPLRLKKLKITE